MTLRPARIGIVLLVFMFTSVPGDARAWTWVPAGNPPIVPAADPREPSLGFDVVEGGFWSARVGHAFVLGRADAPDAETGLEVGLDALVWLWFSAREDFNFPLETVDGSFGLWAGRRHDRFAWRARLAHWSGHLADGAADIEENRIVYSRESLTLLGAWEASPHLRLHGGPGFFYRSHPRTQAFQFQAGGELRRDLCADRPGRRTAPYLAVDLRMKAENAYRVNQSYQAGVRLTDGDGRRALRIHLGYTAGISERGQRWQTPESYVSLGATFGD